MLKYLIKLLITLGALFAYVVVILSLFFISYKREDMCETTKGFIEVFEEYWGIK